MYASVYVHRPAPPARCKLPSERRVPRVSHLGHVVPAVRFDPVDVQPLAQLVAARAQPPRLPVVRLRPAPPAPAHFILRVALTCESTPADSPEGARGWDGEATSQLNGYSTGRALVRQSPMRVLKAGRSEPYSDSMHLSRPARGGRVTHSGRARKHTAGRAPGAAPHSAGNAAASASQELICAARTDRHPRPRVLHAAAQVSPKSAATCVTGSIWAHPAPLREPRPRSKPSPRSCSRAGGVGPARAPRLHVRRALRSDVAEEVGEGARAALRPRQVRPQPLAARVVLVEHEREREHLRGHAGRAAQSCAHGSLAAQIAAPNHPEQASMGRRRRHMKRGAGRNHVRHARLPDLVAVLGLVVAVPCPPTPRQ
jgi:hypothetical protein